MMQRMTMGIAFMCTLLLAGGLLAQGPRGGGGGGGCQSGGGRGMGGGMQGGGGQIGGGGGGQFGAPIFAQGPSFNQPSPQQLAVMRQQWLQQQYIEAVQAAHKQQERQRRVALRRERVTKEKEQDAERREANWARIAAKTEAAREDADLAEAARAAFRAAVATNNR